MPETILDLVFTNKSLFLLKRKCILQIGWEGGVEGILGDEIEKLEKIVVVFVVVHVFNFFFFLFLSTIRHLNILRPSP